jgi:outer membrane lipase/esterase
MRFNGKALAVIGALVLALAGCGGGDPSVRYVPTRLIAFGDELSAFSGSLKYTINASTNPADCATNPIWIQAVASAFGMVFAECNPTSVANPQAESRAAAGDTVADVVTKVDTFIASGSPKREDLVLMLVGMNDTLELFNENPRRSRTAIIAEMTARGLLLAQQVNKLVERPSGSNPVVIVATIPDVGQTPFGQTRTPEEIALLGDMTFEFNRALRLNMVNNGRAVGIVFGDSEIDSSVRFPDSRNYVNVTTPACSVAPPACTTATLVAGAVPTTWLWADDLHPGPHFHELFGQAAASRAVNNPF